MSEPITVNDFEPVAVRKIKKHLNLVAAIAVKSPNHPAIDRYGPSSATYATISGWCNIARDLVPFVAGVSKTRNGVLFDDKTGEFFNDACDGFVVTLDLTPYLTPHLPKDIVGGVRFDDEFILDSMLNIFTSDEVKNLVNEGVVGEAFNVWSNVVISS